MRCIVCTIFDLESRFFMTIHRAAGTITCEKRYNFEAYTSICPYVITQRVLIKKKEKKREYKNSKN